MPDYKLHYFNFRGLGELIRLILHYAGVMFEDVRFERSEWPNIKPNMPFGQVPVLEFDGKILAQSHTIARFLARRYGLAGKDEWEQAQVDMYADCIKDLTAKDKEALFVQKTEESLQKYANETLYPHIKLIEKQLEKNNGVLVGNGITWADLVYYSLFSFLLETYPNLLKEAPNLRALLDKIENHPNIKKYLESRPVTVH